MSTSYSYAEIKFVNYTVAIIVVVTSDMKLQPNVGSDRSWVYKVAADYTDGEPHSETLAIRFANSDSSSNYCKTIYIP